jgi:hypothetical protein
MVKVLEKQINGDAGSYGVQFKKDIRAMKAAHSKLEEVFSDLHPTKSESKYLIIQAMSVLRNEIDGAETVYNQND